MLRADTLDVLIISIALVIIFALKYYFNYKIEVSKKWKYYFASVLFW